MAQSFETLGFLSPEIEQFRRDQRLRLKSEFEKVENIVASAMADLHGVRGTADEAYLVGLGYWLRCLESCQGTVLLSERGLATSPHAVLRTAFECLFYACSVWRHPGLAAKMEAAHNFERVRQAKQMIEAGAETRVEPQRLAELKAVAAEVHPEANKFSAHEAATKGDLIWEYEVVYRGLGLGGAHATLRSLDNYFTTKPDGSFDFDFEPKSEKLDWLLGLVVTCLSRGIERHREASAKLGP